MATGLDVGTSFIIAAREDDGGTKYREFRDAFIRLKGTSPIACAMMEKGLVGQTYFKDTDGSFVVVGQDAIERAVERHMSASRPMHRGIVSPKEKDARRILKFILAEILGPPNSEGEKCLFSVPAQPVDQPGEEFDTGYHEDAIRNDLKELGYDAQAINEAEAICYSELENDDYTGICLSFGAGMVNVCVMSAGEAVIKFATTRCLSKDYLIATNRGLLPISSIKVGDQVVDNLGNYSKVSEVLDNGRRETLQRIIVEGYSENLDMTHDHKVLIKKLNSINWEWIPANAIVPGDRLGVPIIKPKHSNSCYKNLYITNQDGNNLRSTGTSRDLGRFLGQFLGDGNSYTVNTNPSDGRISIAFDTTKDGWEVECKLLEDIIQKLFNKNTSVNINKEDHCASLKFFSKHIAKKLKNLCYDENGEKKLAWSAKKINHQMALGIIQGLIASDGWVYDDKFSLEITSSQVAILFQDLLSRFGIRTTFTIRPPRDGGVNRYGEIIKGKKPIYRVSIGHQVDNNLMKYLFTLDSDVNLPITSSDFIERTVISNQVIEYNDHVFDLVVQSENHCFSSPGGTVHNSGDYIDRMAASSTAQPDSVVQVEKEHGKFTIGQEVKDNPILSAVSAYYVRLIDYTVQHLVRQLSTSTRLPKFASAIPIVISGGTSRANGFIQQFSQQISLQEDQLPFKIKEVRAATDPLRAVARGCLIAASL